MTRKQLEKRERELSLGIPEIIHSRDCGTACYAPLPCYGSDGLPSKDCELVALRKRLSDRKEPA